MQSTGVCSCGQAKIKFNKNPFRQTVMIAVNYSASEFTGAYRLLNGVAHILVLLIWTIDSVYRTILITESHFAGVIVH